MIKNMTFGGLGLALLAVPLIALATSPLPPLPQTCVDIQSNLRYRSTDNSTGGLVTTLQDFLNKEGYLAVQATGFFGRLTFSAVRAFQYDNDIPNTGLVGPLTRAQLKKMTCGGGETVLGTYQGFMNEQLFIETKSITRTEAIANCQLNARLNPNTPIRCTWNGEEIYSRGVTQPPQAAGTLSVATDASSPAYSIVAAGSTGVILGVFNYRPTGEDVALQKINLKLTSGKPSDLVQVYLYDSSGLLRGTATFVDNNAVAILSSPISLTKDADNRIIIKGDVASIGPSYAGTSGDLIAVNFDAAEGYGISSGKVLMSVGETNVAGVRIFRSLPTLAKLSSPQSTLVAGAGQTLYRFSITANPARDVSIYQVTPRISVSAPSSQTGEISVSNLKLYAYTDPSFSMSAAPFANGLVSAVVSANSPLAANQGQPYVSIPASATYYFRITGDISISAGTAGSSGSVGTYLAGDSSYAFGTVGQISASAFVWSPLSTSSFADVGNADWTNGFGVPGLPAGGTDAATLSI